MRLVYFFTSLLCLLLSAGCVDIRYIGDVYPQTTEVRFFMNEKDLPANTYIEIGTATASISEEDAAFRSSNVLSEALRKKALEVGADAIVIVSSKRYKIGTRQNTSANAYYTEHERGKSSKKHGRRSSSERYKPSTHGKADVYATTSAYDLHKDEVQAKFLKRKSSN